MTKMNEKEVKKAMHVGDGQVLNVYFSKISEGILRYGNPPSILSSDTPYLDDAVVQREAMVWVVRTRHSMKATCCS